jgi:hypothetical protein
MIWSLASVVYKKIAMTLKTLNERNGLISTVEKADTINEWILGIGEPT